MILNFHPIIICESEICVRSYLIDSKISKNLGAKFWWEVGGGQSQYGRMVSVRIFMSIESFPTIFLLNPKNFATSCVGKAAGDSNIKIKI